MTITPTRHGDGDPRGVWSADDEGQPERVIHTAYREGGQIACGAPLAADQDVSAKIAGLCAACTTADTHLAVVQQQIPWTGQG